MKTYPYFVYKMYANKLVKEFYKVSPDSIALLARGCYGIEYEALIPIEPKVVIIKIYLSNDMCKNEAAAIEVLSKYTKVDMPQIYYVVTKNDLHSRDALVMKKINGVTLNNLPNFTNEDNMKIADNVINAILDINNIKGEYYGEILGEKHYNSWKKYYENIIDGVLIGLEKKIKSGKFSAELFSTLVRISKEFDSLLKNEKIEPCLMHGDFKPKNVLIEGLDVSGIIDPCGAFFGDIAYEARQLTKNNGNDFNLLEIYKKKTKNDTNIFEKRRLFYTIFNDLHHMLKSGIYFIDATTDAINSYDSVHID